MAPVNTRRVTLTPKAGFVIKTSCTQEGSYTTQLGPPTISESRALGSSENNTPTTARVYKGYKIFLNVCWDSNVPPPPERTDDQIRRAMMGADFDEGLYFVPVVVSDGRPVTDKAGKPSLVFDCVFSTTLRSRSNKDFEFRTFLTEIALERVEDKSALTLSREIATPNISSKGALDARTVSIPTAFPSPKKPLIQEVVEPSKTSAQPTTTNSKSKAVQPSWTAEIEKSGITVTVEVPNLSKDLFSSSPSNATLDVEPHRIIFHVKNIYELDLRLSAKGKLSAVSGRLGEDSPIQAAGTKGMRPDNVTAEWRTSEQRLVVRAEWDS